MCLPLLGLIHLRENKKQIPRRYLLFIMESLRTTIVSKIETIGSFALAINGNASN